MKHIEFTKMVAAGNDFILVDEKVNISERKLKEFAKNICDRKYGVGADGLLLIGKSKKADIRMRIFNADGSEAQMCGNGSRCAALYASHSAKNVKLETKAGIIESDVSKDSVKVKLTNPKNIKLNIPLKVNNRNLKVNFINTGVPHAVIFVEGLDKIDVHNIGRAIRYHQKFQPKGTNVDFVEMVDDDFIKVRTYERGVEAETLACGTGSTASAVISGFRVQSSGFRVIKIETKSGEILKVSFERQNDKIKNVWLEGKARIVYNGRFYV
ncbi:MAG: diaminopimelate epimerase [Candidatus Omnitrophota bacterium]|jgi:diaminopimelate epimerase